MLTAIVAMYGERIIDVSFFQGDTCSSWWEAGPCNCICKKLLNAYEMQSEEKTRHSVHDTARFAKLTLALYRLNKDCCWANSCAKAQPS